MKRKESNSKTMKIAIIGGGGAGMACAYYLDKDGHQVTVYEKQDMLGGNIRTLGQNIEAPKMPEGIFLEAGVVEFPHNFYHFRELMEELEVPLLPVERGSAMFLRNGRRYLSGKMIGANAQGIKRMLEWLKMFFLRLSSLGLILRMNRLPVLAFRDKPVGHFLRAGKRAHDWVRCLLMYSYSTPFKHIDDFPAELGLMAMRDYMNCNWFRVEGGVYTYIEKILDRFRGDVHTGVAIQSVKRLDKGVEVVSSDTARLFDAVVFAVPPGQVLKMLADPTPEEQQYFGDWKDLYSETIVHQDSDFYAPYHIQQPSRFDFFEKEEDWAYNAWLNGLCGIESTTDYGLAYNMQDRIDPEKVILTVRHHVPFYQTNAFRYRPEIIANNGNNSTYHAGAYLGDGLHDGAVASALNVRKLIARR